MAIIKVDKKLCIGCGACASMCSDIFEMKGGKSVVKKAKVEDATCAKDAESACPVGAISVK
ncbi:MAG: ferredoxin [archaeon]